MPRLPNWTLSQESRARVNELLKSAGDLGLDPDAIATGGLAALQALIALKRAKDAGEGIAREQFLERAQNALRALDPHAHGILLQQVQGRLLALQGRSGDTEIAHVTPGEIVLPKALQTPAVLGALRQAAADADLPLAKLRMGDALNSTNPSTRLAEFFDAPQDELEEIVIRSNVITDDRSTNGVIETLHPSIRSDAAKFINAVKERTGIQLRIPYDSGTRTAEKQDELYARSRTAHGRRVTDAPGGKSYHNYGLAFDVVGLEPDGKTPNYDIDLKPFASLAQEHGFDWGGNWEKQDRPHFQRTYGYTTERLRELLDPATGFPRIPD
jgi:hypothetical protein